MERAFDEYVKEVDEMIENAFSNKHNIKQSIISNPYLNLNQKYSHLPEKWRTELDKHAQKIIYIKLQEYYLNLFTKKTNVGNVRTFSPQDNRYDLESQIIELRCVALHLMKEVEKLKSSNILLIEEVENLESSNKQIITELDNQKSLNVVLETELNSLQSMVKYTTDPSTPARTIQRYWRRYLLLKNVKKYAKQYEEKLLAEFRKNLLSCSKPSNKPLEAAEKRMTPSPPRKPRSGSSEPKEWTDRKAAQIARDWLS